LKNNSPLKIFEMKKQHIVSLFILSAFITVIFFAGCKKECDCDDANNSGENWAASVVGTYIGTADFYGSNYPATTIITRIANKTLNIQLSTAGDTYCLDSVSMNSASTFSISEYDGCASRIATGGGNFSGSALNYTWSSSGGSGYAITVSGTK
jgi:hypothetical protein